MPLVPVMVTGKVPVVVVLVVVTVMVDEPVPVTEVGLKEALAPVGKPVAVRTVLPVNPFKAVIVAV